MNNNAERRHIPPRGRYASMSQKRQHFLNTRNAKGIKGIIIFGILLNALLLGCIYSPPSEKDVPPLIIHYDSRETLKEFEPIHIYDQFIDASGDTWLVSHYFLLFTEDVLYRSDMEGVTVLINDTTDEVVAAYWQYGWLVIKRYVKEEIQRGLHVYLERVTHTFLPEPGTAGETVDSMPLNLEETTLLSILEDLGYDIPSYGPTNGEIAVDDINWADVSQPFDRGIRTVENWLEKEGAYGSPRILRLEPLKSFSNRANYSYLIDSAATIVDIRSTLHQEEAHEFTQGQLAYISERMDVTPEENWFIFQYVLKTRAAGPDEKGVDLGSSEAASLIYFLTGLTLPNDALWVNLNPWEPERIIDTNLGATMVGKIMLEADLQMKRDFCAYENPCESDIGDEYWRRLDRKEEELLEDCMNKYPGEIQSVFDVVFSAVTRHWIVPDKITAYEDEDGIFISGATLNIYSEPVYEHSIFEIIDQPRSISEGCRQCLEKAAKEYGRYAMEQEENLILPLVVKEVNTGQQYANLRQVYASLALSQWYKLHYQSQGLFSKFLNDEKVEHLTSWEEWNSKEIWEEYVRSYQNGEYNCVKRRQEGAYLVERTYKGGGINFVDVISYLSIAGPLSSSLTQLVSMAMSSQLVKNDNYLLGLVAHILGKDKDGSSNIYSRTLMIPTAAARTGREQKEITDMYSILMCDMTVDFVWPHHRGLEKRFAGRCTKKSSSVTEVQSRSYRFLDA